MPTICGNCGSSQGPFDKTRIGVNIKNPDPWIVTCAHGPLDEQKLHGLGTLACLDRRAKQDFERWGHDLPSVVRVTK